MDYITRHSLLSCNRDEDLQVANFSWFFSVRFDSFARSFFKMSNLAWYFIGPLLALVTLTNQSSAPFSFLIAILLYISTEIFLNLYIHPLRNIPGPKTFAASRLPYVYSALSGHLATKLSDLHEQNGSVVRTAPNEISFTDPDAWKTIYGQRQSGYAKFKKNYDTFHQDQSDLAHSLFIADDADHLRMRKHLAHAFSDRALREQEPIIQGHIDTLIRSLRDQACDGSKNVNLVDWFNYVAFDIVADLSFGEPFDTLSDDGHRPWVKILSKAWKVFTFVSAFKSITPSGRFFRFLVPTSLIRKQLDNFNIILARVRTRTQSKRDRPDFISSMVKNNSENTMSSTEIVSNASLLIAAGTETVATLLPAIAYLLATNPETMKRLVNEVRSAFENGASINIQGVSKLKYLSAVIDEALRLFPPVPEGLPRVTPPEGQNICNHWIPGGVRLDSFLLRMASLTAGTDICPNQSLRSQHLFPKLHRSPFLPP